MVRPHLDALQFAYQPWTGVEDAIIYLLNRVYAHLDKPGITVRVMFSDFCGAFTTIRPALPCSGLNHLQLNTTKTKKLVVDLRRTWTPVTPVSILGHNVDIEHYKYLGVYMTINWTGLRTLKSFTRRHRVTSIF